MNGMTFSATLPIDLIPPTITTNTATATIIPPTISVMPNKPFKPSATALAWIALPVTNAENSSMMQKTTASQAHFGPRPIMM